MLNDSSVDERTNIKFDWTKFDRNEFIFGISNNPNSDEFEAFNILTSVANVSQHFFRSVCVFVFHLIDGRTEFICRFRKKKVKINTILPAFDILTLVIELCQSTQRDNFVWSFASSALACDEIYTYIYYMRIFLILMFISSMIFSRFSLAVFGLDDFFFLSFCLSFRTTTIVVAAV